MPTTTSRGGISNALPRLVDEIPTPPAGQQDQTAIHSQHAPLLSLDHPVPRIWTPSSAGARPSARSADRPCQYRERRTAVCALVRACVCVCACVTYMLAAAAGIPPSSSQPILKSAQPLSQVCRPHLHPNSRLPSLPHRLIDWSSLKSALPRLFRPSPRRERIRRRQISRRPRFRHCGSIIDRPAAVDVERDGLRITAHPHLALRRGQARSLPESPAHAERGLQLARPYIQHPSEAPPPSSPDPLLVVIASHSFFLSLPVAMLPRPYAL